MFVRKIKSNKGIIEIGKFGIDKIDVDMTTFKADVYTAGGNIFQVHCKKILNADKVVCNSRHYRKNLF